MIAKNIRIATEGLECSVRHRGVSICLEWLPMRTVDTLENHLVFIN